MERELDALVAQLTIEEKVTLVTGRDFWSTQPIDRIGLRSMVLSDGPSGVRGPLWDERDPSLNLPSASALSASWDVDLAGKYGAAAATEAIRKRVDVVLGPTVNLHRSPLGGRHFEAYSEDPILTAVLAASFVRGVQDLGVAATPKHYVANDSESDRFTIDVRVGERALHELYLRPFEECVTIGHAWAVMSAYNSINGITATESELLESPLNVEWGFDGVVVSDWTAVRSLASAAASQDLAMPGPNEAWGARLLDAVRTGVIAEAALDRKVHRILSLAKRVGALGQRVASDQNPRIYAGAFAREAAIEGMVLLENRDELPWEPSALNRVAVIGNNALVARTQGGGSATVIPPYTVSPLEGLRSALPEADVQFAMGATTQEDLMGFPESWIKGADDEVAAVNVRLLDRHGAVIFAEDRHSTALVWFGGTAPVERAHGVELDATINPDRTGPVEIGCATTGHVRFWLDDELVIDDVLTPSGDDLAAGFLSPAAKSTVWNLTAGRSVRIRAKVELPGLDERIPGALALTVGTRPAPVDAGVLIAEAVDLARDSDVALVVVGTNASVESEGFDRTDLALPGHQDELVRAVAAANPRTVVIVNAGSPVVMPWREDVAAVIVGWFGGQEFGAAIAEVVLGIAEPGGRLPTTWPDKQSDVPVIETRPTDGRLDYAEGLHVGYRAWLRSGTKPAYWMGHGLGYTNFDVLGVAGPQSVADGDTFTVETTIKNTGRRRGKHVVQVYAERPDSAVERPVRWLVGFAVSRMDADETAVVAVEIPVHNLQHWDGGWQTEAGMFRLRVGSSANSIHAGIDVLVAK